MKWTNRTRPKSTPIGVELRARWARRGDGNRARPRIRFHNQPPALGPGSAICALGSRRKRRDRVLPFIAGPESQVIRRYVDDHCQHNEKSSHPEKGAVMHPFPIRTVRRVFGVVGSAMLLEFGIIHGWAIDSSGRPKSPTIFCRAARSLAGLGLHSCGRERERVDVFQTVRTQGPARWHRSSPSGSSAALRSRSLSRNRSRPRSTPIGDELRDRWARRGNGNCGARHATVRGKRSISAT